MRFHLVSLLFAFVIGCGHADAPPLATETPVTASKSEALGAIDCPWGAGQCAWPGSADSTKTLHVGGWKTGTGTTAKVQRSDLLAKFTMQGAAFLPEVVLSAYRDGVQDGSLWVEVRADDLKPEAGRLLARGRTLVRNARDGAFGELRVPLHTVSPVTRLLDGATYWLRVWVQPSKTSSPAAVWLDASSVAVAGQALRTCAASGATWSGTCPSYSAAPARLLAFLPRFENLAAPSCEDRVQNGDEAGRDCGTTCAKACGRGSLCFEDRDCGGNGVCRAAGAIGPGQSDRLCGRDAGDARETCVCAGKRDLGDLCGASVDCLSGLCQGSSGARLVAPRCVPATCDDGRKNGDETDVDCGGGCGRRCIDAMTCTANADCDAGLLCGGDVKPYRCQPARPNGVACTKDWQCGSGACVARLCRAAGRPGETCDSKPDCDGVACLGGKCSAPTYADRLRNGSETDVDCGGAGKGFKACVGGQRCAFTGDCKAGLSCTGGLCGAQLGASCTKSADCLSGLCGKPTGATRSICLQAFPNEDLRHCNDKILDADETDLDCGGVACSPCADKLKCSGPDDCLSGVCSTNGQCAPPTCKDGIQNGQETAIDCGGAKCGKCVAGVMVPSADSCLSGVRSEDLGICLDPTCFDGRKNGTETDVDCGGGYCAACADTRGCAAASDCANGVCPIALKKCAAPSNADRVRNGDETDVDCGGSSGKACALRKACRVKVDCVAGSECANGQCAPAECANGVLDKPKGEVDVDCGGPCGPCATGKLCTTPTGCRSGICAKATPAATTKTCAAPSGSDGLLNGNETAKDCGGTNAPGCAYALPCLVDRDCASDMVCLGGRCNFGACGNSSRSEGAPSCGRMCSKLCNSGESCRGSVDCGGSAECFTGQDGHPRCVTRKCNLGGREYKPGEPNPADGCQMCDPDLNQWVARPAGTACDDGFAATHSDRCVASGAATTCQGTAFSCSIDASEKCVASKAPLGDGQRCETDEDCLVVGAEGQKRCEGGRCEGVSCRVTLATPGTVCGTSSGACSAGGLCDGTSATCPAETALVGVVCREAATACDEPEYCVAGSIDCPNDGKKLVGATCSGSAAGHCDPVLACVSCLPGERWVSATSACVPCTAGEVSLGGDATTCVAGVKCPVNKTWSGKGTTCDACPAGSTSPGGAVSACAPCTGVQKWDGSKCVSCPDGQMSDGGASTTCRAINCARGDYWDASAAKCRTCAAGTTSTGGAVTSCTESVCGSLRYATSYFDADFIPFGVVVGDPNEDGWLDFLVSNQYGDMINIFTSNHSGSFSKSTLPTSPGPSFMSLGDLDNDNHIDLAVGMIGHWGPNNNVIELFKGHGDGTFTHLYSIDTPTSVWPVYITDINGDHQNDVIATSSQTHVYLNKNGAIPPTPSWSLNVAMHSLHDMNRDGFMDIIGTSSDCAQCASVLLGNGDGTFIQTPAGSTPYPGGFMQAGDITQDGLPDVVAATGTGMIVVLKNTGFGALSVDQTYSAGNRNESLAIADLNNDGRLDVASSSSEDDTIDIFLTASNGTLAPRVSFDGGRNPVFISTGDFNHDGVIDLVTSDYWGRTAAVLMGSCP
ncbi:MAG: hypothetical protein RL199_870 [Pseudomonadota bacterium]|jgi:hypothetical protein